MYARVRDLVAKLYKDEAGQPLILTDGQANIFTAIFSREHPRNHIMCYTRYGKSLVVALAVLTRASHFPERWAIVAGTKERAKIIMEYVIQHIYDNVELTKRFQRDKNESDDDIKRHRNKSRINFKLENGLLGEIFICSAKEALGWGAPNVVEDESALINNIEHSYVMRMLGDSTDNFLCKISNPMQRNHFLESYLDPAYYKIDIDCEQGIKEGRISREYVEEQRNHNKLFQQFYNNKFPAENEIDESGYMNLFWEDELNSKLSFVPQEKRIGIPRLGVDVGHGGDTNVWTVRWKNFALKIREDKDDNVINVAIKTKFYADKLGIPATNIFIDGTGVGIGVVDYMRKELSMNVISVINGSKSRNKKMFNHRAHCYWRLAHWDGSLDPDSGFDEELLQIKYKVQREKKVQIMSKEEMRRCGIDSPNRADSLALTFSISDSLYDIIPRIKSIEQKELDDYRRQKQYG